MVNLTLPYAKTDQTEPSTYLSLHNEVKASLWDYDFIYTDHDSVLDNKAAAAIIDNYYFIEGLTNKSIFSA